MSRRATVVTAAKAALDNLPASFRLGRWLGLHFDSKTRNFRAKRRLKTPAILMTKSEYENKAHQRRIL